MRTCQSILVIILAFSFISCQTLQPKAPTGPKAQSKAPPAKPGMEYKAPPTLIEQYTESYRPSEVVQPLTPSPEAKPPAKKAPPGITGSPLPAGLLSPTDQEPMPPPALGPGKERQKIVFNFDKADIGEVTSQIFGDHLKVNFVVDQGLQGE